MLKQVSVGLGGLLLVAGLTVLASYYRASVVAGELFGPYRDVTVLSRPYFRPDLLSSGHRTFWCVTYCSDDPLGCCFPPCFHVSFLGEPQGMSNEAAFAQLKDLSRRQKARVAACRAKLRPGDARGSLPGGGTVHEAYAYTTTTDEHTLVLLGDGIAVTRVDPVPRGRSPDAHGVVGCWGTRDDEVWIDDGQRRAFRRAAEGLEERESRLVYRREEAP